MADFNARVKEFLADLTEDPIEHRVTDYVIRELHNGRDLFDILADPYVKNRLNEQRVEKVLETPEIIEAFEEELRASFTPPDILFGEPTGKSE